MKKRAKKFVPKYPGERSLTEAEIVAAAESDPDALPLTKSALAKLRRVPAVKRLRWELGLTSRPSPSATAFHSARCEIGSKDEPSLMPPRERT